MIKRKLNIKYFYCCDRIIVETFPHGGNLMKKFKALLLAGVAVGVLGVGAVGVAVGAHHTQVKQVKAATETTVYYAVPSATVGNYLVKLNVNFKGDGEDWHQYTMDKTLDTYNGNDVYRCTYTDAYDGVGVMQFQLYDGDAYVDQQQPIGAWTTVDNYNGKIYVHNLGWSNYTPGLETYIPMTSAFFTNWTDDAGTFRGVGANCWNGKPLNALGSVMDGCLDHEWWTGTLTSRKWHQTTQWIYFQYGCANNSHVGEASDVKMTFKLWASADAETPAYEHDFHNDTFSQTTLLLRNYMIPTTEFNALGGDFYMSIDFFDGRTDDYGANEFGYLHVNQTHEQVSDAQWYYYTHCVEGEAKSVDQLRENYYLNGSLRDGFVTGFAESFDTQYSFNINWMKDNYGNDVGERHQDRAISHSTYRANQGTNMPFNSKNGFFKGWYGAGNDDREGHVYGYVASDDSVYRFVSKPFRLPANGLVSVMMAGNSASLHLIDFDGGHDDLAWVDCKTFVTAGSVEEQNPIALTGKNVCTMVRHVINFSKYAGRLVQIGIADVANKAGGWNAVYFDELKADYDAVPSLHLDVVEQDKDYKSYSVFNDVYVKATEGDGGVDYAHDDGPAIDESPLFEANQVWLYYLSNVRGGREGQNVCNVLTTVETKAFLNAYNDLSVAAKQLVCASDDFQRIGSGDWWKINPTIFDAEHQYNLAHTIQYLGEVNNIPVVVYRNDMVVGSTAFYYDTNMIMIIVLAATLILTVGLLVFYKKKRKH